MSSHHHESVYQETTSSPFPDKKTSLDVHLLPVSLYLKIFVALLGMLFANIGISFLPLDRALVTTLLVSVSFVQATLLAVFFMELVHEDKFYSLFFALAVLFVALFFVVAMFEIRSRDFFDSNEDVKAMRQWELNNQFAPAGPEAQAAQKEK